MPGRGTNAVRPEDRHPRFIGRGMEIAISPLWYWCVGLSAARRKSSAIMASIAIKNRMNTAIGLGGRRRHPADRTGRETNQQIVVLTVECRDGWRVAADLKRSETALERGQGGAEFLRATLPARVCRSILLTDHGHVQRVTGSRSTKVLVDPMVFRSVGARGEVLKPSGPNAGRVPRSRGPGNSICNQGNLLAAEQAPSWLSGMKLVKSA